MKRGLLLVIFCVTTLICEASHIQTIDSVRSALNKKPSPVLGFNNRMSYVFGDPSRTLRLFGGLDFNRTIRFELAYNVMLNPAVKVNYPGEGDTLVRTHKARYFGLQVEYTFYHSQKWKLSTPVQFGFGSNHTTRTLNGDSELDETHSIFPIEPGINAIYYVYDWVGVKGGTGLRLGFGSSFSTLTGPYYNLGITLYAGELLRKYKTYKQQKASTH